MNTAFLDPARHVKAHVTRLFRRHRPINLRARDPAALEQSVAYALQVAHSYLRQLQGTGLALRGSKLLELGPGSDFGPQLILAGHGLEVAVADRFLAPWDDAWHPQFYRLLRARCDGPTEALDAVIAAGFYPDGVLRQIPRSAEQLDQMPDRFDCILSNAVLEHVADLGLAARNLARITKPSGVNLHQIDFHDHRYVDRPLEFLLLTAKQQERLFHYWHGETGNRVRLKEAVATFREAGFSACTIDNRSFADEAYMAAFMPRLRRSASPYRDWEAGDLRILGARLVLGK
jgi:SAM-dependent methyltransferase